MGVTASVIGIGNLLLQDEGVGVHAINHLRERYSFPAGVDLIDGGTMGLDLLPYIEGRDHLMLIDAVDFGEAPGTIRIIEDTNMKVFLDLKFSVHQIGIPDMLFALDFKGITPPSMCLVGIQPAKVEAGSHPSPLIRDRMSGLYAIILEKLGSWGIVPTVHDEPLAATPEYRHVSGDSI